MAFFNYPGKFGISATAIAKEVKGIEQKYSEVKGNWCGCGKVALGEVDVCDGRLSITGNDLCGRLNGCYNVPDFSTSYVGESGAACEAKARQLRVEMIRSIPSKG